MIIQSGKQIILSGNRQKAGQYVQIAQRRAMELRILLDRANLRMGQKKYWLHSNCVWCAINIIEGAEFIRIHACPVEDECSECGTIIMNPYQLTPVAGNPTMPTAETPDLIDMEVTAGGCWNPEHPTWGNYAGYIANYGDGTGGYTGTTVNGVYNPIVKHWYREPGAYTITTKAWNRRETSTKRPTILTRTTYNKLGPWIDWNDYSGEGQGSANVAHAACAVLPWTQMEPQSGDLWYSGHKLQHNTVTSYRVYMRKTVWTWDLSDQYFYTSDNAQFWIKTSCGHIGLHSSENSDMGEADAWWHKHQRVDHFKIVINGTSYPCQVVDGNYIGLVKDLTDILPPLIAAGGTLTIEFTDVNDFAVPLPYNTTYRSGTLTLRYHGWSSYKVFHLSSADPNCVVTKTQTALINAT